MVLTSTGQSTGRMVTTISVFREKPNSKSPTGANATPGIGRKTSMLARL